MIPSYLNKYHFIYYSVHAMSFNSVLRAQYGVGLQQQSARLKRFKLKLSSAKNEVLFLERCRHSNLTPKFLCNRCPVKSRRATQLTKNYRLSLLRECLTLARRRLFYATKSIADLNNNLKSKLSAPCWNLRQKEIRHCVCQNYGPRAPTWCLEP